ncbi:GntR family transcriptional regulator [Pseudoruegeria sp. HB172150]|uniref:GntR family transcriptional regulator n=1 Tax=Pseudoruegeria sp. HB172150 TaxID=2721164 RepID=UPI001556BA90|nr:GntR family transcriptional regulator [Pseudoruegeria sp. HB172150]
MDSDDANTGRASLYSRLLTDMIDGQYPHGTPLRVQAIARKYGTSVNPVREVLRRMEGEGLVEFKLNKGATVTTMDRQQVVNIFELIRLIEPYLTAGFAKTCTRKDLDEVMRIHDRIRDASPMDRAGFGALDYRFHLFIVQNHYNEAAVRTWVSKRQLLDTLTRRKVLTKARHREVLQEHEHLIEAFRDNDVERATEVITQHVDGAGRALAFHLDSG